MQPNASLDVADFRKMVENLCLAASADFAAARQRLERLRRHGPEPDDGGER